MWHATTEKVQASPDRESGSLVRRVLVALGVVLAVTSVMGVTIAGAEDSVIPGVREGAHQVDQPANLADMFCPNNSQRNDRVERVCVDESMTDSDGNVVAWVKLTDAGKQLASEGNLHYQTFRGPVWNQTSAEKPQVPSQLGTVAATTDWVAYDVQPCGQHDIVTRVIRTPIYIGGPSFGDDKVEWFDLGDDCGEAPAPPPTTPPTTTPPTTPPVAKPGSFSMSSVCMQPGSNTYAAELTYEGNLVKVGFSRQDGSVTDLSFGGGRVAMVTGLEPGTYWVNLEWGGGSEWTSNSAEGKTLVIKEDPACQPVVTTFVSTPPSPTTPSTLPITGMVSGFNPRSITTLVPVGLAFILAGLMLAVYFSLRKPAVVRA